MDKFLVKKRSIDDDEAVSGASSDISGGKISKSEKIVLIVAPGASGSISKAMHDDVLLKLPDYEVIELNVKWKVVSAGLDCNIDLIHSKFPLNTKFYIIGNSFGNRVICELLRKKTIPSNLAGVILCGFPLYGEEGSKRVLSDPEERVKQLKLFPKHIKLLLLSGSKDEFLNRKYLNDAKGKNLLTDTFTSLQLTNTESKVFVIDGGTHDVAKGKANATELLKQIKLFCV